MASRWTWSPTGDPNLFPNFGRSFVDYWGRVSVCPLVFIRRATAKWSGPTRILREHCDFWWHRILPPGKYVWVEDAHNSLPVSSTGLSPFECSLGYQPPIFPSLESEVVVPSAHAFVQRCRRTWRRARETPGRNAHQGSSRLPPVEASRLSRWSKGVAFLQVYSSPIRL